MGEKINEHAEKKAAMQIAKAKAIQESMFEIINEQKDEIIKRSLAKIAAQGFPIEEIK